MHKVHPTQSINNNKIIMEVVFYSTINWSITHQNPPSPPSPQKEKEQELQRKYYKGQRGAMLQL